MNATPVATDRRYPAAVDEYLRRYIRHEVARGRRTAVEIVREVVAGGGDPAAAWALVAEAFAEHRADAATWPAVTDNDRLTTAFARLDAAGIVARASFTQTLTDGGHEIRAILRDRPGARGFAFYHEQDESSCVASGACRSPTGPARRTARPPRRPAGRSPTRSPTRGSRWPGAATRRSASR
nr:hypothetical protein GCM10020063_017790 [Dactylosporangium thailandense]